MKTPGERRIEGATPVVLPDGDRWFVYGCLNLTLKSFCPCTKCGYWEDDECVHPNPETHLEDSIIKGRWEIMKFDIPKEEIILDTIPDVC